MVAFTEENNASLNNLLRYVSGKKYCHQCFFGDLKFRNINWLTWNTPYNERSKETQFIEIIHECYFYQHQPELTRSQSTDNTWVTDLALANEVMQVSDVEDHATLGKIYHCVITFKYDCYLDYSQPKERYVYLKTDFDVVRKLLVLSNSTE